MKYAAIIEREGKARLAEFPECPGCQTFAEPGEDLHELARDALEAWLEANLQEGNVPPRPRTRRPTTKPGEEVLWVEVPAKLAVKLLLRWSREDRNLTQAQLARLAGVSQQMIAKIERPDYNPTVDTLEKIYRAMGMRLRIDLEAPAPSRTSAGR